MLHYASHQNLPKLWAQLAAERGAHTFLIYDDPDTQQVQSWTYADFHQNILRLARGLRTLGVENHDNVAVQLGNTPEFLESFFALVHLGATLVPLPAGFQCEESQYIIEKCAIRTIITSSDYLSYYSEVDSCNPHAKFQVILTDTPQHRETAGIYSYAELKNAALEKKENPSIVGEIGNPANPPANQLAEIMFTSGTTSHPKGVMLTHANLLFSGAFQTWQLAMQPTDRYATTMTVEHVNFQLSALMPVLAAGATLILFKRYSASTFWKSVVKHDATVVQGMAMIARTMLAQPVWEGENQHNVRVMHYFLPLTNREKDAFTQRFNLRLLNSYGSTETLVGVATDLAYGPTRWPSVGRVGLGYGIEIRDPYNQPLPVGEVGEICVWGQPGVTLTPGYYEDAASTRAALEPAGSNNLAACGTSTGNYGETTGYDSAWFHTGDLGYFDADGWLYFVDRRKNLIKRAGENISASEIEDVLMNHPGIKECAVIGVDDPIKDQAVAAFIVLNDDTLTVQAVKDYCAGKLAYFKVPTHVQILKELPKSQYGKIKKSSLALNEEQ